MSARYGEFFRKETTQEKSPSIVVILILMALMASVLFTGLTFIADLISKNVQEPTSYQLEGPCIEGDSLGQEALTAVEQLAAKLCKSKGSNSFKVFNLNPYKCQNPDSEELGMLFVVNVECGGPK